MAIADVVRPVRDLDRARGLSPYAAEYNRVQVQEAECPHDLVDRVPWRALASRDYSECGLGCQALELEERDAGP